MAALDFTNRTVVLAYLTDVLPNADTSVLEALLDASAGNDCGDPATTVYRPFWVQATVMSQTTGEFESVTSAAGSSVVYRDQAKGATRAVLRQQAALDKALCGIPDGFEAAGGRVRVETVF